MSEKKSVNLVCNVVCGVSRKSGKSYVALVCDLGYRQIYVSFGYRDVAELVGVSPSYLLDLCKPLSVGLKPGEYSIVSLS